MLQSHEAKASNLQERDWLSAHKLLIQPVPTAGACLLYTSDAADE